MDFMFLSRDWNDWESQEMKDFIKLLEWNEKENEWNFKWAPKGPTFGVNVELNYHSDFRILKVNEWNI